MIKPSHTFKRIKLPYGGALFFILFYTQFLNAQVAFQKFYNYSYFGSSAFSGIRPCSDSGFLMVGGMNKMLNEKGEGDYCIIKTQKNGQAVWTKNLGTTKGEGALDGICLQDGGYLIGGVTQHGPQSNPILVSMHLYGYNLQLIKLNNAGDTVWTRIYGADSTDFQNNNYLGAILQTQDGGYVLVGNKERNYLPLNQPWYNTIDIYLVKTNSNGDTLWTKTFNYNRGLNACYKIRETKDKGFILCGATCYADPTNDALLMKLDSTGNIVWQKSYGGVPGYIDDFYDVRQTADGGYIAVGETKSFPPDSFNLNTYVVKTDSNGDTLWTRTYFGLNGQEFFNSILSTDHNTYTLLGKTNSFADNFFHLYVVKLNALGDTLFTQVYGPSDGLCSSDATLDKGFIIGGQVIDNGSPYGKCYVVKADSMGRSGCRQFGTATITGSTTTIVKNGMLQPKSRIIHVRNSSLIVYSGYNDTTLCSNVDGIGEFSKTKAIRIFPNPASQNLKIESNTVIYSIKLVDLLGKETPIPAGEFIDISFLDKGLYMIQLKTPDGLFTSKFIKN